MPSSRLAGETLCQRLQASHPNERAAVKSVIGEIIEDMLGSLGLPKGDNFNVQLAGTMGECKRWGDYLPSEIRYNKC